MTTPDASQFRSNPPRVADERAMSLDDTFEGRNGPISFRWVYVHMIEE